jgi:Fur family ferric uptake transcriptional regulator
MNKKEMILRMERKGVKPTANRLIVACELNNAKIPLSLADLTERIPQMDRSSLFRVLTFFLQHDVVDSFEDGRGIINYELCETEAESLHHENHVHFYCEICHRSYCLRDIQMIDMENVAMPEGFVPHGISFVIKGICSTCKKSNGVKNSFSGH